MAVCLGSLIVKGGEMRVSESTDLLGSFNSIAVNERDAIDKVWKNKGIILFFVRRGILEWGVYYPPSYLMTS